MQPLNIPGLGGHTLEVQLEAITTLLKMVEKLLLLNGPNRLDTHDRYRADEYKRKLRRYEAKIKLEIARRDQTSLFS